MLLGLHKLDLDVSYSKGTEMRMANLLYRAYFSLVEQGIADSQEIWSVPKTRSPTEFETECVDMAVSVPIWKLTLQEIKSSLTEVDADFTCIRCYYQTRLAR